MPLYRPIGYVTSRGEQASINIWVTGRSKNPAVHEPESLVQRLSLLENVAL